VKISIGAIVVCAAMTAMSVAAERMKPTERVADTKPKIQLEEQVPAAFGEWTTDKAIMPIAPSPDVQATLNRLYSAMLARTYRNAQGQRVMLSIAYGSDQSNEATSVHRPEFCYSAQGFRVKTLDKGVISLDGYQLSVQRLMANQGPRAEPITYWITINDEATLPGITRKLEQLRYGLQGKIPDGLLFRVSTIGMTPEEGFAVQDRFIKDLYQVFDARFRSRYFGGSINHGSV
jgi:EpsI family protein